MCEKVFDSTGMSSLSEDDLQHHLWNCDETGFSTAVASKRILARRGEKEVHETIGGSGRECITVLAAGCADGIKLPPYVVYKGKNLWSRWTKNGPVGCLYSVSDSGWMEGDNFMQWFSKLFVPAVKHLVDTAPVILFFDGHHSHISIKLIEEARYNKVHLICLPPHTTHILQPLDVSVFGPVKNQWKKCLKQFQIETCASVVTKEEFPHLLAELYQKSFLPHHFKSGFRACGLYPLCRDAIPSRKLSTALPFTKPSEPESGDKSGEDDSSATCTSEENEEDYSSEGNSSVKSREDSSSVKSGVDNSSVKSGKEVVIHLSGTLAYEKTITPIRLHLRGYFADLLQKKKECTKQTDRRKLKPRFYGEALTADEIYERMLEEEHQKEKTKKAKTVGKTKKTHSTGKYARKKAPMKKGRKCHQPDSTEQDDSDDLSQEKLNSSDEDDGICEECGRAYADDTEKEKVKWMGCDTCERWFHYDCLNLSKIPTGFWSCAYCG
jgi:hypothetical protein